MLITNRKSHSDAHALSIDTEINDLGNLDDLQQPL